MANAVTAFAAPKGLVDELPDPGKLRNSLFGACFLCRTTIDIHVVVSGPCLLFLVETRAFFMLGYYTAASNIGSSPIYLVT